MKDISMFTSRTYRLFSTVSDFTNYPLYWFILVHKPNNIFKVEF